MIPQPEDKFKRVFWHEVGHFLAHFFNQKHFGKLGTEKIEIFFKPNFQDFTGALTPKRPEGMENYNPPVSDLTSFICVIIYGCICQCVFTSKNFEYCFDEKNEHANGGNDAVKFWSVLTMHLLPDKRREIYSIVLTHFDKMKKSGCFNILFNQDINFLILDKGNNTYEIDLVELVKSTIPHVTLLEKLYLQFYNEIKLKIN